MPLRAAGLRLVIIVGLGPVGLLLTLLLNRRGIPVIGLEAGEDPRQGNADDPRSFAITLNGAGRGAFPPDVLARLEAAGLRLRLRNVIRPSGRVKRHRYGLHPEDAHLAISRRALRSILLDAIEREGLAELRWCTPVVRVEPRGRVLQGTGRDGQALSIAWSSQDLLVGTDGVRSVVRTSLQDAGLAVATVTPERSYLNFRLTPGQVDAGRLPRDGMLFAPACGTVDVGLPTRDGGMDVLLLGADAVDRSVVQDREAARKVLRGRNLALLAGVADPEHLLIGRRAGRFVTTWTSRWSVENTMVLGDAAHAMPAYAGVGFNSGALDAAALVEALWTRSSIDHALVHAERARRSEMDAAKDFTAAHGARLLAGQFGSWSWSVSEHIDRLLERLLGRRTPYQELSFPTR